MEKLSRKRRIRIDRLLILIGGALLCLLLIVGAGFAIMRLLNPTIIANEFKKPNMEVKLEDDKINSSVYSIKNKETGEKMIYAIHVPKLNDKQANEKIANFVNDIKNEKATVTHIDYQSNEAFSQYKSYVITATTYQGMEGIQPIDPIATEELFITFDKDQSIDLEDCIRDKAIKKLMKAYNCEKDAIKLASIHEDGLVLDIQQEKIEYLYQEHPTSFVMNNEKIPTILKNEKIVVEKRTLDPSKPMIAFTFDDGPNPTTTTKILQALDKVGGRATFFELGYLMETYPDMVREIVKQGSEVGNHSYDHDWLTSKSIEEAIKDIDSVNDYFFSLTGNEINLVRPPYGDYNKEIKDTFVEKIVMWDVDTRDWESRNKTSVINMTKKYTYDGAIVLFHDIYSSTADAVVELIDYYHSKGYQFVTVSELYEMKGQ